MAIKVGDKLNGAAEPTMSAPAAPGRAPKKPKKASAETMPIARTKKPRAKRTTPA